jgi:hypothetical protein
MLRLSRRFCNICNKSASNEDSSSGQRPKIARPITESDWSGRRELSLKIPCGVGPFSMVPGLPCRSRPHPGSLWENGAKVQIFFTNALAASKRTRRTLCLTARSCDVVSTTPRTRSCGSRTQRATALLFEWSFFGRLRLKPDGASKRYNFEFLTRSAILCFRTRKCVFKMYVDGFFFFAPGSRVFEVLYLQAVFSAMRTFGNLTDAVRCNGS